MSGVRQIPKATYWRAFDISDVTVMVRHNLWLVYFGASQFLKMELTLWLAEI